MPTLKNELSASLPQLSKAVFSRPTDAAEYEKRTSLDRNNGRGRFVFSE